MFDRKFGIELEIVGINGRDAAVANNETDTVFSGIPATVERFYTARSAAFAASQGGRHEVQIR